MRLERIRDPDPQEFRRRYIRPRRPVVVVGALEKWPTALRSFPALVRHCGDLPVDVDWIKGASFIFERRGRTPTRRMRLGDFIEGAALSRGYVQARADAVTQRLRLRATRLSFEPRAFLRRIESIWIGGGAGYGLHHDIGTDQFLCQLAGRKLVLLLPDDLRTTAAVHLEPLHSGRFYRSSITDPWSDPRLRREPEAAALLGAERYVDTLEPGEVLYMLCAWFHALRPVEPGITVGHRYLFATRFAAGVLGSVARHVASSILLRPRASSADSMR